LNGRARRRLRYIPLTLRSRWGARPGPAPADDAGWARLLDTWVEMQAARLSADALADADGQGVPAPGVVGRGRRLWNLAHLARNGIGGQRVVDALPAARAAVDRHLDLEHGGYLWAVGAGPGAPPLNDQKLLYGQCVVVHGLSELALADPAAAPGALADAEAAVSLATARLVPCGAVAEFLDRRWRPLPPASDTEMGLAGTVTLGGQLHLVEALATLVEAGGGEQARTVGQATIGALHDHLLSGPGHPDRHWVDEDGAPLPEPLSLGHKVEAAWILADGAPHLGVDGEAGRARRWVDEVLDVGFRQGGLDSTPGPAFRLGGRQRSWWVQVELLRALVEVDRGPDDPLRPVMRDLLGWLHRSQVDPRTGQARQLMTHWGLVLVSGEDTSARTGYHDLRAYVAAASLLRASS
jgi:mannose/cellobiose epimerase-like protein (N-acyl-D-glucosamine 2-epimerase family)